MKSIFLCNKKNSVEKVYAESFDKLPDVEKKVYKVMEVERVDNNNFEPKNTQVLELSKITPILNIVHYNDLIQNSAPQYSIKMSRDCNE